MVKTEYKTVMKEVVEVESEKRFCDICGAEITSGEYFAAHIGHHDWPEGFKFDMATTYDICSPECLHKKFDEYLKIHHHNRTEYISVEHVVEKVL